MRHEFAIVTDTNPTVVHRGPMSEGEATEWMLHLADRHRSMFRVVRREVSPWEEVDLNLD